jgi:UPF0176 protein
MNYRVLLFYKYVWIENPQEIVNEHLQWCLQNDIKGRVFIAPEGINGTVSGATENIENYKIHIRSFHPFNDIWFKEDETENHAFNKIQVRLKKEIVNSGLEEVSPDNGGKRLSPDELIKFYNEGKDFIIVDARNWYESRIGRFKNALTPHMKNFRGWRHVAEQLKDKKDKTIVTYCTGGVRCEKASAYLVKKGFKDVYQLDGGIINFIKKYSDTYWVGGVFVFDERRVVDINSNEELKYISKCHFCGKPTSYYINCHNLQCDKLFVCCHDCKVKYDYCCSDKCRASSSKRSKYYG